jgi:hypothetical protein
VRSLAAGASSSGTIVASGGLNELPPGVSKIRIVPQKEKEDEMDVDGDIDIEGSQNATMQTSSALMESALAGQPGQEPN